MHRTCEPTAVCPSFGWTHPGNHSNGKGGFELWVELLGTNVGGETPDSLAAELLEMCPGVPADAAAAALGPPGWYLNGTDTAILRPDPRYLVTNITPLGEGSSSK